MPLSEQERRLLDEMERSLYQSEGDDVTTVGGLGGRASYAAIVIGVLAGLAGIVLLIVGVMSRLAVVGIIGFAVMFGGVLFAIAPPRRFRRFANAKPAKPRRGRSSLMDSLGDRWDRRTEDRDR